MSVSGYVVAKCKKCNCVWNWHVDSLPFVDSEIIGTCGNCIEHKKHKCIDETKME